MDPQLLFKECLKDENLEEISEKYYRRDFDQNLIISKNPDTRKIIQIKNDEINSILEKYLLSDENEKKIKLNSIIKILKRSDSQYYDLSSSFPLFDMTNGLFQRISLNAQITFLSDFIPHYIEKRYSIYKKYGLSPITMQLKKDFGSHKNTKEVSNNKLIDILKKNYSQAKNNNFEFKQNQFFLFDNAHDRIIEVIEKVLPVKEFVSWKQGGKKKKPDVGIIDNNLNIFICEMKHVKESGGGQDKQFIELYEFITRKKVENRKIHLVSFLDGYGFNSLNEHKNSTRKIKILDTLGLSKNKNYYVNTYGFKKLFFC